MDQEVTRIFVVCVSRASSLGVGAGCIHASLSPEGEGRFVQTHVVTPELQSTVTSKHFGTILAMIEYQRVPTKDPAKYTLLL